LKQISEDDRLRSETAEDNRKSEDAMHHDHEEITRREFTKQAVVSTTLLAGAASGTLAFASVDQPPQDLSHAVVAELGGVFIPSRPADPGYKDLEKYGITKYVMQNLPAGAVEAFNSAAKQFFEGKAFLDLDDKQREQYLELIIDGSKISDAELRTRLQGFYRAARARILSVYYKNYPEHEVKRNAQGEPILKPGDTHQITNPNTKQIVTGWDIAGFQGPLDWEEEERCRAKAKKTLPYWYEGDLVKLANPNKPPSPAIKTSEGHDYYDVVVVGGGTAGCIVAGRIAERGVNPKTGDRLRVAMIEGGDDWTIRDPGMRPGYGYPIRRRMITNIRNEEFGAEGSVPAPSYRWHWDMGPENFKLVGGCSLHYGGMCWIPGEEDFHSYREASGVDWDLAKFGDAIQEIRDLYHVMAPPDAWWSKGDHLWADAGRALGFQMYATSIAFRNPLGSFYDDLGDTMNRYDSKGTSLPWVYIGLNHGLKVIANAEVEKILIEKSPGARPVATGAVYKDKSGTRHEVRAARVIVACAANWTPQLLYKSGYGPRDYLGDQLLVENKNVGDHVSGDLDLITSAYLSEPITPEGPEGEFFAQHGAWTSIKPRPWGELSVQIRSAAAGRVPDAAALGAFAPGFGWEHKEYMRNGAGVRRILTWRTHLGAIPWSWRVRPEGRLERVELDAAPFDATIKEAAEVVRAWHGKLAIKPVKVDFRAFSQSAASLGPHTVFHRVGSARAGASRETSVCSSDFDCHDIDHLLITSSATIPRTFFWSLGPTAVNAAYAWRRMIANHFSRGCSTRGFA
jgi:choline dehydrogenase-like flavoprotein